MAESLDTSVQASSNGNKAPNTLPLMGEDFVLPSKMPFEFVVEIGRFAKESASRIEAVKSGSIVALADAVRSLLGAEQWERLMALSPSSEDFMALVNAVTEHYTGLPAGEPRGSAGSSKSTGEPSSQTSSGSTPSDSTEPSPGLD